MRIAVALVCWLAVAAGAHAASDNSFAVRDTRVFDGHRPMTHTTVVVRDGRIAAVGPSLSIPAGLDIDDGAGKTLIPGLIDAHVHIFPGARADALRFGVTTELDMFDVGK
jgi:imidazolonepropionase-like amidohydrolase